MEGTIFVMKLLHRKGLEYFEAMNPAIAGKISNYCYLYVSKIIGDDL